MPFRLTGNDTVEVPMMIPLGHFPFGMTNTVQILQLPCEGGNLSMIIVLPREPEDLLSIEEQMTAAVIDSW